MATKTTAPAPAVLDREQGHVRRLVGGHEIGILVATLLIFLFCAVFVQNFLTGSNLLSVAQQIAFVGIVGTGMTFLIVAGEIDLSVGSQYGFLSVMMAYTITEVGVPVALAAPLVLVGGALIGLIQGLITTAFKIPSFVVTLAGLAVLRGAALLIAGGQPIAGSTNQAFHSIVGGSAIGSLAAQTVWMAVVMGLAGWVLSRTKFGYDVYAVGGSTKAAMNAGIPAARIKVLCFVLTGALSGLAAVILVGWLGSANPLTGTGFELNVIAAVVVGGASLAGGVGSITGTLFGAVVAGLISNALVLYGVDGNWQQVATGLLILGAVLINRLIATRQATLR
jgi:ribose transport system permease protein